MKYTHSTHLLDFGTSRIPQLAIVCGNYCRRLRSYVSGDVRLSEWQRIPSYTKEVIPCVEPIVEVEKESGGYSYAAVLY